MIQTLQYHVLYSVEMQLDNDQKSLILKSALLDNTSLPRYFISADSPQLLFSLFLTPHFGCHGEALEQQSSFPSQGTVAVDRIQVTPLHSQTTLPLHYFPRNKKINQGAHAHIHALYKVTYNAVYQLFKPSRSILVPTTEYLL